MVCRADLAHFAGRPGAAWRGGGYRAQRRSGVASCACHRDNAGQNGRGVSPRPHASPVRRAFVCVAVWLPVEWLMCPPPGRPPPRRMSRGGETVSSPAVHPAGRATCDRTGDKAQQGGRATRGRLQGCGAQRRRLQGQTFCPENLLIVGRFRLPCRCVSPRACATNGVV